MNKKDTCVGERRGKARFLFFSFVISTVCLSLFSCRSHVQKSKIDTSRPRSETTSTLPPKVTQIDASGLKEILKPTGKPRLINFWATWCGPCREEFPDLVKIATDHKDRIDTITVSLDEPTEIAGEVPRFLAEMRSESPAYLLKTPDVDAAIDLVSEAWQGALPFTILYSAQGETLYSRQGKFDPDILVAEIEKL